jgi:hypothetical protein
MKLKQRDEKKTVEKFLFGDLELSIYASQTGERYVRVMVGRERRVYQLEIFIHLFTQFEHFVVQQMKAQNS